jgi:hypothetical protein
MTLSFPSAPRLLKMALLISFWYFITFSSFAFTGSVTIVIDPETPKSLIILSNSSTSFIPLPTRPL